MRYLIFLLLFWNVLTPSPPGYAVNPQTKQCGSLGWEDEYRRYSLPSPWEKHYESVIQNGNASCQLDQFNTVETCCKKVGYMYVPGDIGEQYGTTAMTSVAFIVLASKALPFLLIGLIVYALIRWLMKWVVGRLG